MNPDNKNFKKKVAVIYEITNKLQNCKSAIFFEYHGLKSNTINELRSESKQNNVEIKVFKNTLINLAFKNLKLKFDTKNLKGPNAILFSYDDELGFGKFIRKLKKNNKKIVLKDSIIDNNVIDKTKLLELINIPSKKALYGSFASALNFSLIKFLLTMKVVASAKK